MIKNILYIEYHIYIIFIDLLGIFLIPEHFFIPCLVYRILKYQM